MTYGTGLIVAEISILVFASASKPQLFLRPSQQILEPLYNLLTWLPDVGAKVLYCLLYSCVALQKRNIHFCSTLHLHKPHTNLYPDSPNVGHWHRPAHSWLVTHGESCLALCPGFPPDKKLLKKCTVLFLIIMIVLSVTCLNLKLTMWPCDDLESS